MQITDTKERYGFITRLLHWGMALLLLWQFLSAGSHLLLGDTPVEEFFWATHKPLGFLLLILIFIRSLWALANLSRRPPSVNRMATRGHVALYGLIFLIPSLALLRQYGSGETFEPLGITLFSGFEGDEIAWMVLPANLFHSWFGWALLLMIIGHVFMAFQHRRQPGHVDVLPRMK